MNKASMRSKSIKFCLYEIILAGGLFLTLKSISSLLAFSVVSALLIVSGVVGFRLGNKKALFPYRILGAFGLIGASYFIIFGSFFFAVKKTNPVWILGFLIGMSCFYIGELGIKTFIKEISFLTEEPRFRGKLSPAKNRLDELYRVIKIAQFLLFAGIIGVSLSL